MKKKILPILLLFLAAMIAILLLFRTYHAETTVLKSTFTNSNSHTITYHICATTYTGYTPSITGLHTAVISQVFDLESAQLQEELEIHGCPAAIYRSGETLYFCITISPEASSVLEYSPDAISEEDVLRIMNSIFEYPDS